MEIDPDLFEPLPPAPAPRPPQLMGAEMTFIPGESPAETRNRLAKLLEYDPENGLFYALYETFSDGTLKPREFRIATRRWGPGLRYTRVHVDGRQIAGATLAWLFTRGEWPKEKIQRRDGDPGNDRIANLYVLSELGDDERPERKTRPHMPLYHWERARISRYGSGWQVYCYFGAKQKNLGRFNTRAEAQQVANNWNIGLEYV